MGKNRTTLIACLLLIGCQKPYLEVHTKYETKKDFASYHVCTPDPALFSIDSYGESLVLSWEVPEKMLQTQTVWIQAYIRLKDGEEKTKIFPLTCRKGHTKWSFLGDDYYCHGGIFTFKAALIADGTVLKESFHPLYTPLIRP